MMSAVTDGALEALAAMEKFPQPNYVLLKIAEEAGEVVKAGVHHSEGRETWVNVEKECIQCIAMCLRLLAEGDQTLNIGPGGE